MEDSMTIQVYNDTSNRVRENSQDFKRRLRQDLLSRDGHRDVARHIRMLGLCFSEPAREKAYHSHKASFPAASTLGCPLAALALWLAQTAILPWHVVNYIAFALGFILLAGFATVAVADTFSTKFPPSLVKWSAKLNGTLWIRTVAGALAILTLTFLNIINMGFCSVKPYANCSSHRHEETTPYPADYDEWPELRDEVVALSSSSLCTIAACLYPSYYSPFVVLILVVTSLVALLSHTAKLAIMCAVVAVQIGMNFGPLRTRICCERLSMYGPHDVEKASRVLFVWRMEVEEQREKAADMRRRNESLVYNILPPHVAAHFLRPGAPRRHDELYSQSYAEVGVLFASMPNFSGERTTKRRLRYTIINRLECLRFLNEVISDYDALLERPEFQDIIKIKTIGSTYMAASGLKPKPDGAAEESEVVAGTPGPARWSHLALLVEFAFELKRALTSINEQSFNHFVLKMGINHGPITAGVIGARKPHYDIWGNSVTEETCGILRPFGYQFEQRGLVSVKGKGQLMTYYLTGKGDPPPREETSLSTDQISAVVTGGDEDISKCTLKSAISGNSATQLLASSVD
ncbi:hypothetical protein B566_EDAN015825 [Ephemera danica]|nr:hypothetical protein B566_EDAN015825 [Ephemera danica]